MRGAAHLVRAGVPERVAMQLTGHNKVAPRQIDRLRIPCIDLGKKTKRYLVKDVAAWLESKRRGGQWRESATTDFR